jgi:hypothetical protein
MTFKKLEDVIKIHQVLDPNQFQLLPEILDFHQIPIVETIREIWLKVDVADENIKKIDHNQNYTFREKELESIKQTDIHSSTGIICVKLKS